MRRLPIYFVLDVSESMVGEPVQQVQEGMRMIIQDLRNDPYSLETVFVSVIAFAGKAHSLSPLEELYKFYPPDLPIGDGTSLGEALNFLMDDMDKSIQKTTVEVKEDWKPIIFLFTDGVPTDDPSRAIKKWNDAYRTQCSMIAVSIGNGADVHLLGQITEHVLRLNETDKDSFKKFFAWITASVKTSSLSVSNCDDDVKLAPVDGINLEKIDLHKHVKVDENFIVLLGKCINTGKLYLVKYGKTKRMLNDSIFYDNTDTDHSSFRLIGAYVIDEKNYNKFSGSSYISETIKSDKIFGLPTCPCCGNQIGFVVCGICNRGSCYNSEKVHTCPWCGNQSEVIQSRDAFDLARERG